MAPSVPLHRSMILRLLVVVLGTATPTVTSEGQPQLGPLGSSANIMCTEREGGYFCTAAQPCPSSTPQGEPAPGRTPTPMPGAVNISCSQHENGYFCTEAKPCPQRPPERPPVGADGNYPVPAEGVCPAHFKDSLDRMGVFYRGRVQTRTQDGLYLGYRYNFDATPKSKRPFCAHAPGRQECEQWKPCQDP